MMQRTLSMIKPNAVKGGHIGDIVARFEKEGLKIAALKMKYLSEREAEGFYAEHKSEPFFPALVRFMSSGPICALVLEGENAIVRNREIMGSTNPETAAPGTLRALYASSMKENAVHGSDSEKGAAREIRYFFPELEIF